MEEYKKPKKRMEDRTFAEVVATYRYPTLEEERRQSARDEIIRNKNKTSR